MSAPHGEHGRPDRRDRVGPGGQPGRDRAGREGQADRGGHGQGGDAAAVAGVLARQRAHLLRELRGLSDARNLATTPVVGLLVTAAELHVRADLQLVDAAEAALGPETVTQARARPAGEAGMRHAG